MRMKRKNSSRGEGGGGIYWRAPAGATRSTRGRPEEGKYERMQQKPVQQDHHTPTPSHWMFSAGAEGRRLMRCSRVPTRRPGGSPAEIASALGRHTYLTSLKAKHTATLKQTTHNVPHDSIYSLYNAIQLSTNTAASYDTTNTRTLAKPHSFHTSPPGPISTLHLLGRGRRSPT